LTPVTTENKHKIRHKLILISTRHNKNPPQYALVQLSMHISLTVQYRRRCVIPHCHRNGSLSSQSLGLYWQLNQNNQDTKHRNPNMIKIFPIKYNNGNQNTLKRNL